MSYDDSECQKKCENTTPHLHILDEEGPARPMTIGQEMFIKNLFKEKSKELDQIFSDYTKKMAESADEFRKSTLKQMNEALVVIDKKFSNMYGTLVHKFLINQEQKVFNCEMGVQGLLETSANYLFDLHTGLTLTREQFAEEFQKKIEKRMAELAGEMKQKAVDKMAEQMQEQNSRGDAKNVLEKEGTAAQAPAGETQPAADANGP